MRIIGMDIHRVFAEAALENREIKRLGRIGMMRDHLEAFVKTLLPTDHIVVGATGNATAVTEILAPHVARVAVANPLQVHLIAKAKIRTDAIDARVVAKLYGAGFLPEVWIRDAATLARRRQVTRRRQLVQQRVRLKSIVQSILHANLIPPCPFADLFGGKGRTWLRAQYLPDDEREAVGRHVEEYDRLSEALKGVERDVARAALADANVKRLMTIPGVDMVVTVGLMAAIGRIDRFDGPDRLVAYIGLNPSVYQSGTGPAQHGRITKRGRSDAAISWSRPLGRRFAVLGRCAPSTNGSVPSAALTSQRSRSPASWRCSSGTFRRGERITTGFARHCTPRSFGISNCGPGIRRGAARKAHPTTISSRSVDATSRRQLDRQKMRIGA